MWTEGNYRRIFLDMHIDDWNEEFMSQVNPSNIVELLKDAGAQQVVVKTRSHTGLSTYPTKIGRMHRGLKGRNYTKEMIELCHENGIAVMAYFSQVFDNYAYDNHPDWRLVNLDGKTARQYCDYKSKSMFRKGRYGLVCPNNEDYRQYVKETLEELTSNYQFESIFLDMPFWSEVCYCPSCKKKYFERTGKEMPTVIDWYDEEFKKFQEIREEWMAEFTMLSTKAVKGINPEVTIEHNMSPASAPWQFATTDLVADACDYVGGDLYGGFLEQSFICKYYRNLSKTLPFVYITSRCDPGLSYHTTSKTEDELLIHSMTALVHNGAFSICDGANPDGTLADEVYQTTIKNVFAKSRKYEEYVSGDMLKNVSVLFAHRSKYDLKESGHGIDQIIPYHDSIENDFIRTPLNFTKIMRTENIPYDVIASKNLVGLKDNVLALSDVANIRDDEMVHIEEFLKNGGNLYISGHVGNKRLLELLEAESEGLTGHNLTYMNPTESGKRFFHSFNKKSPMAVQREQELMKFNGAYELLATLTLPYTMTGTRDFSSIHSNPPGIHTEYPSAIIKNVHKGKILWISAPIEDSRPYISRQVVGRMIKELAGDLAFTSNAAEFIEIVGWNKEEKTYVAAINQQETAPLALMYNIYVDVPYEVKNAVFADTREDVRIEKTETGTRIFIDKLHICEVVELTKF